MIFLKNCWYAAMWSEALPGKTLVARTLLDEPLIFFRDVAGLPVAMDDMCPHRLAPLRLGKLTTEGRVQCGYHGLEFASDGQCVKNPHGSGNITPGCRVKTYPLQEKHTLVWIWMGSAWQAGLVHSNRHTRATRRAHQERFGALEKSRDRRTYFG